MHTVSTLRERQRTRQRRHVAKLRARRAPLSDDLARALLRAVRKCVADRVFELALPEFKALVNCVIADLERRGFSKSEAQERLARALISPEAISR